MSTPTPEMASLGTSDRKFSRKTVENATCDGSGSNFSRTVLVRITKFYALVGDNQVNNPAVYDVTS